MTENKKHTIEINGVKMEIDLRHATQIHTDLKEIMKLFDEEIRKTEENIKILKSKKEHCEKYLDVFVKDLESKSE
jgi:murein tripeptide amidase MpaA